jgi:hypothetical protein
MEGGSRNMITGLRTHIFIGSIEVLRAPGVFMHFERHVPLSRVGITLPDPAGELYKEINNGDNVEVRLGYRDEDPDIWTGSVSYKRPGTRDQIVVNAVGEELPLSTTFITQSWENETPEAIIKWAIGQAGMEAGAIDSPGVVFPRFVAACAPVWQVACQCAHTCQKAFGIDMSKWALWMGADGKIYWGDFDEPGDTPVIETGAGLIKHSPDGGDLSWSTVETFLTAGFRHSMKFRLVDTRRDIDDEFRALQVRHEVKERSVRTFIRYGEENEKF